ncbi:MAG: hypothetical protein AMJ65_15275 [Phycisphaerae bacterium SG8_4]|nr:MAG: hypothetical protein AMJ65_15275 [Phycisphaerae bacterium SG8_4]
MMFVGYVAAIVLGGANAKADFIFGEPVNLGQTVNSPVADYPSCLSADGLELYLASDRSGGHGRWDIWVAKRETTHDDWGIPMNLGPKVNSPTMDVEASVSVDGLELYFSSNNRAGGHGGSDIWVSRRQTKDGDWGDAVNLGPIVNSSSGDAAPWISTGGLELYFDSDRPDGFGSWDIWVSRRPTKDDPWGEPTNLGPLVNSSDDTGYPSVSSDGLLLLCSDTDTTRLHPGGFGSSDIWMSKRKTIADSWGEPVNLGPVVNGSRGDGLGRISPDGRTLYLCRPGPTYTGGTRSDIWQAPIIPIVDFNGDGNIDTSDLVMLIDSWGTDDTLYDTGPMPWGDGIVDIEDLKVFMEHWEKENMPQDQENDQ